jgi:hypothetical protein
MRIVADPPSRFVTTCALQAVASRLFAFAVPVLILQHAGLIWAIVHHVIRFAVHGTCVKFVMSKVPAKPLLPIGLALSAAPLALLMLDKWDSLAIIGASIILGVSEAAWYFWYHVILWRISHSEDRIKHVSFNAHIISAIYITAPLVAAWLTQYGKAVPLIAIAVVFLLAAWLTGRHLEFNKPNDESNIVITAPTRRATDNLYLAYAIMVSAWQFLYPLAVVIALGGPLAAGTTMTGASLLVLAASSIGLVKSLQQRAKATLSLAVVIIVTSAIVRSIQFTVFSILATQLFLDVGERALMIKSDQESYAIADAGGIAEIVRRETLLNLFASLTLLLAVLNIKYCSVNIVQCYTLLLAVGPAYCYWSLHKLSSSAAVVLTPDKSTVN